MKRAIFWIFALLIPIVLFGVAEVTLRLAGVGGESQALFEPVTDHPDMRRMNPRYFQRYFGSSFVPTLAFTPFAAQKKDRTFRVVALGASTTVGYPYYFYHGFPSRLQERLEVALDDRVVEVLNLGVTAVNSYYLYDTVDEIVALQPDMVVLYAGHNEYYGAMGVGSAMDWSMGNRVWINRLVLRLRDFATYRALETALARGTTGERRSGMGRTLMERVIGDHAITYGGETYRRGVAQYEANLSVFLRRLSRAGIPVIASTLVSNLKDQAPLGDEADAAEAFVRGRSRLAEGDTTGAAAAFLEAKELDGIRFRAPEALNDVLKAFEAKRLLHLVDLRPVVDAMSRTGIPDASFFSDHLHPGAPGYDAMAAAIFRKMVEVGLPATDQTRLDEAQEMGAPGIHEMDHAYAFLQVYGLMVGYPFEKSKSDAERARALTQMLRRFQTSNRPTERMVHSVMANLRTPEQASRESVPHIAIAGDTAGVLQLYLGIVSWDPFDVSLQQEAEAFALEAPEARFAVDRNRLLNRLANLRRGRELRGSPVVD